MTPIPATQNTAPILEHRCLYTHDIKRKQKRWQDGLLRYHTFNKRVMIYDVPRNFVGDTHWRESQPVQDGDEFALDRGVLIQVGEETGRTEQDLSGLLEKRSKAPDVPVPTSRCAEPIKDHIAPKCSRPEPTQALRPKSLNSVLGTPRYPVGKSLTPIKSPYEARRDANGVCRDGAATHKHPRGKESCSTKSPSRRETHEARAALQPLCHVQQPRVSPTSLNPTIQEDIITDQVSSSKLPTQAAEAPRRKSRVAVTPPTEDVRLSEPAPRKASHPRRHETTEVVSLQSSLASEPHQEHRDEAQRHAELPVQEDHCDGSTKPRARGRLRMAPHEPRKKLMYRGLLPPVTARSSPGPGALPDLVPAEDKSINCRPKTLSTLHSDEQDRLSERLQRFHNLHGNQVADGRAEYPRKKRRTSELPNDAAKGGECHSVADGRTHQPIPRARPEQDQETHSVLSKMDEMLMAKAQPKTSRRSSSADLQAPLVLEAGMRPHVPVASAAEGKRMVDAQSSPPPDTHELKKPPNQAAHKPETPIPRSSQIIPASDMPINLDTGSPPISNEDPASQTADPQPPEDVPLPRGKALPTFKRPARRSPLKKAISDTSSVRPPPEAPTSAIVTNKPSSKMDEKAMKAGIEQIAQPWSSEAWDLFGCRIDGAPCSYQEFVGRQQVIEKSIQ